MERGRREVGLSRIAPSPLEWEGWNGGEIWAVRPLCVRGFDPCPNLPLGQRKGGNQFADMESHTVVGKAPDDINAMFEILISTVPPGLLDLQRATTITLPVIRLI